ncbi:unnamed protein product [Zymoseptoria tritici ST99CH_1A5]|uniref:Autophagy-related protein 101 n=3 Tax=Zymoseptoria tritici TaxID=1047171 RepID=A0A1X7S0Y1_ZYMT9|nr:unnamed protein product [Zymoseptoria tritici ST99CH_3D7]SMR56672.1 unnamed protein product [Zymoseptoria tritici ST99CH_1E4]SMR59523.1 unnamed protein product [Zymoseptoria tritici ST99CH_3D1]SMY26722.1 unnamed protein product [Zymoseptoria tritici ST99CH_1A5]
MEARRPPEYSLSLTADRSSVKDIVKGILHTIFFHRYFPPLTPSTQEILDLTLPYVSDPTISTLIETRLTTLLRTLDSSPTPTTAHLSVSFLERKRRKGWFASTTSDETVWETWHITVEVVATVRSEGERERMRRVMEKGLREAVMRVVEVVNAERGHIPPITTNETNPFPFRVVVEERGGEGWGGRMGIF